jgi:hypothetical protein
MLFLKMVFCMVLLAGGSNAFQRFSPIALRGVKRLVNARRSWFSVRTAFNDLALASIFSVLEDMGYRSDTG